MNITKSAVLLFAGVASLAVACSTDGVATSASQTTAAKQVTATQAPSSARNPHTQTASTVTNAHPVNSSTTTASETGTIVVHVSEVGQGRPLGDVELTAHLVPACDPSHYEMPAVDGFLQELRNRTDSDGNAVFTSVPLGCWSVRATVPAGYSSVETTRASVFLVRGGDSGNADLELQRGLTDPCSGDALAVAMGEATINVPYCDGSWAQVAAACGPNESCENGPGDNARILRLSGDIWETYTTLPSTLCLSDARRDGVPADLEQNFNSNC